MKKYLLIIISFLTLLALPFLAAAQRPELIIPATHSAGSVIISPDDKWLVSAGNEGIKIWDNKTGSLLKNLAPGRKSLERFKGGCIYMAMDAASRLLAMEIEDSIFIFDFDRFQLTSAIKIRGQRTAMLFTADGKSLYTAGTNAEEYDTYLLEKINIPNFYEFLDE